MKPAQSWYVISLMICHILCASIFFRMFKSIFINDTNLQLSFIVESLSDVGFSCKGSALEAEAPTEYAFTLSEPEVEAFI